LNEAEILRRILSLRSVLVLLRNPTAFPSYGGLTSRKSIAVAIVLLTLALVFAVFAWRAPVKTISSPTLKFFPGCYQIYEKALNTNSDTFAERLFSLASRCYDGELFNYQVSQIPSLQNYQAYAEIAFGFAVSSGSVVLVSLSRCPRWLKRRMDFPTLLRIALMGVASVCFGMFAFFEGSNIAFAYTRNDLIRDKYFHLLPNPQASAALGLLAGASSIAMLRSRKGIDTGVRSGVLAFALPMFTAQLGLLLFGFGDMSLYVSRSVSQFFLLPPYSFYNPYNVAVGIPIGVPLLSNWAVLLVAGSLVALAILSGQTAEPRACQANRRREGAIQPVQKDEG